MEKLITPKSLSLAIFFHILFMGCILYDEKLGLSQLLIWPMLPITVFFLFSIVDLTILWSNFKRNHYLRVINLLILIISISLYIILNFTEVFDINLWLGGILLFGLLMIVIRLLMQIDKEHSFQILLLLKKIKPDNIVLLFKFVGSILIIGFTTQFIYDLIKNISVYNYTWLEIFGWIGYSLFISILFVYTIIKVNADKISVQ